MGRKVILFILIMVLIGSVFAITANWHKLAEIVGVVKPPSTTLIPIKIDLGTLQPAQHFTDFGLANLTCNTYYQISKLILAIPSSASEWYTIVGGFRNLYLRVGVDVIRPLNEPNIPVIVNGSSAINPGSDSAYWKFEYQETPTAFYSYKNWTPQRVEPGNHTVLVYVTGETSIPARQVNFSITLYLEINPSS